MEARLAHPVFQAATSPHLGHIFASDISSQYVFAIALIVIVIRFQIDFRFTCKFDLLMQQLCVLGLSDP